MQQDIPQKNNIGRRSFLKASGACAGALATFSTPKLLMAGAHNDKKLFFIKLAGGLRTLMSVAIPYADPHYSQRYRNFAIPAPGSVNVPQGFQPAFYLSDQMGLHWRMPALYGMFSRGEATIFHGVASSASPNIVNNLSHFESTKLLDNGLNQMSGSNSTGWINRLLEVITGEANPGAVSINGGPVPMDVLRGPEPTAVFTPPGSTPESATLTRIRETMGNRSLRQNFDTALARRESVNQLLNGSNVNFQNFSSHWAFPLHMQVAAMLASMDPASAPAVIAHEMGGFDWHVAGNNGTGYPASRLAHMDEGLAALVDGLKASGKFSKSLIIVASEFGGSAEAATDGIDHGSYGAMLVISGDPNLMSRPGEGIVGNFPGYQMMNAQKQLPCSMVGPNLIRQYVAAFYGLSQSEIDYVIPYQQQGMGA